MAGYFLPSLLRCAGLLAAVLHRTPLQANCTHVRVADRKQHQRCEDLL